MAFDYASYGFDLTDRTACVAVVTEKTGLAPTDLALNLGVSAGTDPSGTTVYRPYYVAARLLSTRKTQLLSGEGASFADPFEVAQQLMRQQLAIDRMLNLTIPSGMRAVLDWRDPDARSGAAVTEIGW